MSESFKTTYYFNPNVHDGYQDVKDVKIAEGINGIIKVKEWASVIGIIDIACFTDCYEPELQKYFRDLDIPVFGSGYGSRIETDRLYLKQIMESVGLPIGQYEVVQGIDMLENTLKDKESVFLKSDNRGNFETTKWKNWKLSKGEIRRMRRDMGIFGMNERYIIEEEIDAIAEPGIDTFVVDGQFPSIVGSGIEIKDSGFAGCFMYYNELPKQIRDVTDKMSPLFRDLGYRGCFSNEVIIGKDKEGYLLDATCRIPNPPGDAMLNAITNYAECVINVANGIVPVLRYDYKYYCQFILKSDIAQIDDTPLIIPDQFKKYVAIKNLFVDNEGTYYYSRRGIIMKEIGSVSGFGSTLKEAIEMATEISESIEAEDAHVELSCMSSATDSLKKLAKAGINYFL
jgi:hypothetical protein